MHGCRHLPTHFMTYILIFPLSSLGWHFRATWNPAFWAAAKWQNKRCHHHLWEQPLPRWSSEPWGNSGQKQRRLAHSWGAYQRGDSSKPRPLHLPIETGFCKCFSVNLVVWKTFFFFPTTFPLLKKLIYPSLPPSLLRVISQGYLRCCLLDLSPNFTTNKT